MSNLPGNPYHDVAESMKREYGLTADKESLNWPLAEMNERLAAIAYEQRTANLIAWQALGIQIEAQKGSTSEPSPEAEDDIANRLGLGENK